LNRFAAIETKRSNVLAIPELVPNAPPAVNTPAIDARTSDCYVH
jgi:hypothetical protein